MNYRCFLLAVSGIVLYSLVTWMTSPAVMGLALAHTQGGVGGGVPCAIPSPTCPDAVASTPVAGGWNKWLVGRYRFNIEAPGFWTSEQDRNADGLRGHSYTYSIGDQYYSVNAIFVTAKAAKTTILAKALDSAKASFTRQFAQAEAQGATATFKHDRDGSIGRFAYQQYRVDARTPNGHFKGILRFLATDRFVYVLTRLNGDDSDADGRRFFESFELRQP